MKNNNNVDTLYVIFNDNIIYKKQYLYNIIYKKQ